MTCFCLRNGTGWYPSIKRYESTILVRGQTQQVDIREMFWCQNSARFKEADIAQRDAVRPKDMFSRGQRGGQPAHVLHDGKTSRIVKLRHHTNAPILSNRARRPTERSVSAHPGVRRSMMHMRSVKERDEHVDIWQPDHASLDSSRIFCTSSGVTTRLSAGKISNPFRTLLAFFPR